MRKANTCRDGAPLQRPSFRVIPWSTESALVLKPRGQGSQLEGKCNGENAESCFPSQKSGSSSGSSSPIAPARSQTKNVLFISIVDRESRLKFLACVRPPKSSCAASSVNHA